jgi:hypothetical protein
MWGLILQEFQNSGLCVHMVLYFTQIYFRVSRPQVFVLGGQNGLGLEILQRLWLPARGSVLYASLWPLGTRHNGWYIKSPEISD